MTQHDMNNSDEIKRIAVVGAGQMGTGIALEFARFGYSVALHDVNQNYLEKSMLNAREELSLMAEAELISDNVIDESLRRINTFIDLAEAVSGAQHVVEAVPENLSLKQTIFAQLDDLCPPQVTLATNASGLRVDDCAGKVRNHPERILATHYWQPAHLMPLVEIIGGRKTSAAVIERVARLLRKVRKRVVIQEHELPTMPAGWGNALQWVIGERAKQLIDEGGCTPQQVDDLIRFGFGRRMTYTAQFIRTDLIGLDFAYNLAKARGNEPWKPYKEMVERGDLGMKSGRGFYDWSGDKPKQFLRDFNLELIRLLKNDMQRGDI
jgi:3-hydroxybutyryl-CoA dehydrogenase